MANHKSAEKRTRQTETRRIRNRKYISSVKTAIKRVYAAIDSEEPKEAIAGYYRSAQSIISKAAAKGLFHRNNASRRVGRLSSTVTDYFKTATEGKKPAAASKTKTKAKKTAAKKKTAKKKTAKKSTAKKKTAKKTKSKKKR